MKSKNSHRNRFYQGFGSVVVVACFFVISIGIPQTAEASVWDKFTTELIAFEKKIHQYIESLSGRVLGTQAISVTNDKELFDAIMAADGGETIALAPGNYGNIFIRGDAYFQTRVGSSRVSRVPTFTQPIKITSSDPDNRAVISEIELRHFGNVHFENLSIRPAAKRPAVRLNGENNAFIRNDITYGDASNWTAQDWVNAVGKVSAISISGKNSEAAYNYLKNVGHGIYAGNDVHVHHNYIEDFSADGIRGNGDNAIIEFNYIVGPIKIDSNHDDGFQSFSRGDDGRVGTGVVKNVILRNNSFIAMPDDHPLRTNMQGIGMFDGYFEDWIIENNLILTDHWHGISVYGGINTIIRNNLALDVTEERPGPMWVRFFNHKDGTPSVGGAVVGNITNRPTPIDGNTAVSWSQYGDYFVDHHNGDFSLKPGAVPFSVGVQVDFNKLAPNPLTLSAGQSPVVNVPPSDSEPAPVNETVKDEEEDSETEETVGVVLPEAKFKASDMKPSVGQTVTFDGSQSLRADRWMWDDAAGELGRWSLGEGEVIKYQFRNPGVKQVRLTVSNESGQNSTIIPIEVVEVPASADDTVVLPEDEPKEEVARVQTTANLNVRTSPNSNITAVVPAGTQGDKSSQPAVTAGGHSWVFVTFDNGVSGYVSEAFLTEVTTGSEQVEDSEIENIIKKLTGQLRALQAQLDRMLRQR